MPDRKLHYRVVTHLQSGKIVIQRPHFQSEDDAKLWIEQMKWLSSPKETVEVVRDFDDRVYPFWKPNHSTGV